MIYSRKSREHEQERRQQAGRPRLGCTGFAEDKKDMGHHSVCVQQCDTIQSASKTSLPGGRQHRRASSLWHRRWCIDQGPSQSGGKKQSWASQVSDRGTANCLISHVHRKVCQFQQYSLKDEVLSFCPSLFWSCLCFLIEFLITRTFFLQRRLVATLTTLARWAHSSSCGCTVCHCVSHH